MAMIRSVMQVRSRSMPFQLVLFLGPATTLRTKPIMPMEFVNQIIHQYCLSKPYLQHGLFYSTLIFYRFDMSLESQKKQRRRKMIGRQMNEKIFPNSNQKEETIIGNLMDSHSNIQENLIMKEETQTHYRTNTQLAGGSLHYESVKTEGQCILKSITPVLLNKPLYYLYVIFAVVLLGIPAVFAYWYPRLKLFLYFEESILPKCTHFAVVNYDNQLSIVERKEEEDEGSGYDSDLAEKEEKRQQRGKYQQYPSQYSSKTVIYFMNRYMKYTIKNKIVKAAIFDYAQDLKNLINKNLKEGNHKYGTKGLGEETVLRRRKKYGQGAMEIERPSITILFLREIMQPLYFFIIFSLILWMAEEYFIYCGAIFFTSAVGIILNLYQTYQNNNKIHGMAYYETDLFLLRGSQVIKTSSKNVVPGDVVFFKEQIKIPFDGIIIEGSALINQCALTGQSVPVVKKGEDLDDVSNGILEEKSSQVFEGTSIVQVDNKKKMTIYEAYRKQYGIPVYVTRTNFFTMKGQLIRIISFPLEKSSIFEKQSKKFLFFLFCIAVLSYSLLVVKLKNYVDATDLVTHFLDLITVTVPPGLPVSMTFGVIYALEKLSKKEIFCISPNKVIVGGLVDFICFDKTGTLTQDYMDFHVLVPCIDGNFREPIGNEHGMEEEGQLNIKESIEQRIKKYPYLGHILTNMATNHTIVNIQATSESVGDPMEIKLFEFGEFKFSDVLVQEEEESQRSSYRQSHHLHVLFGFDSLRGHSGVTIRRMDFDSELFRMSAIARATYPSGLHGQFSEKQSGQNFIYTKGSPQSMQKIFDQGTVPANYNEMIKQYASQGLRVLAIGHRHLDETQLTQNRLELEKDLVFDGFQIFQNRLKSQTKAALTELTGSAIPCVMITGDNALTACSISYKCKIADGDKKMLIVDYNSRQGGITFEDFRYEPDKEQDFEIMDEVDKNQEIQMKIIAQLPKFQISEEGDSNSERALYEMTSLILQKIDDGRTQLCLTGSAFDALFRGNFRQIDEKSRRILQETKVYARAKPNGKAKIITAYQNCLKKTVAMCGDGANDCGALKQADIGLSLSQTEASISSPFTSKVRNISAMVELIKECRAGLVTNFSLFNIMALYSLIQYTTVVICQYNFSYPSNGQFMYWDIFGNFFFFMTVGYTATTEKLSAAKPSKSLFTITNLAQIGIMYLLQLLGQLFMIYSLENFYPVESGYESAGGGDDGYTRYKNNGEHYPLDTPETNILFLFSNFMYIFSFVAFSYSRPWRKQFYTNIPFMLIFVVVLSYTILIVVFPKLRFSFLELSHITEHSVAQFTLFISLLFSFVVYFNQKCILEPISVKLRRQYPTNEWM